MVLGGGDEMLVTPLGSSPRALLRTQGNVHKVGRHHTWWAGDHHPDEGAAWALLNVLHVRRRQVLVGLV